MPLSVVSGRQLAMFASSSAAATRTRGKEQYWVYVSAKHSDRGAESNLFRPRVESKLLVPRPRTALVN